ncbi:MAG TPA: tetratricopeptide repeat protein, partial [Polyangiaceae bacterium]
MTHTSERAIRPRATLLLSALLVLQTLAGSVHAEERSAKAQAREHFQTGLALVRKGYIEQAVEAFENAYRTSPRYAVLYNLGQAYAMLGRSTEAVQAFERYLNEGGNKIAPARRDEVLDLIEQQKARSGRAEFDIHPAGAETFIDGR